jgi:hypothetical protein
LIAVLALGWSRIEPDRNYFRAKTAIKAGRRDPGGAAGRGENPDHWLGQGSAHLASQRRPGPADREGHGDAGPSHTNVCLDNNCSTSVRVKVIMRWGLDSSCLSLKKGEQNRKFVSGAENPIDTPVVERIDVC